MDWVCIATLVRDLVRNRAAIDRFIADHGAGAVAGYVALYVAVIGLSLPGGAIRPWPAASVRAVVGSVTAIVGALAGSSDLQSRGRGQPS
jgi:uncharacterized membrane protein YdjX (TVP38/TMEM64 family)